MSDFGSGKLVSTGIRIGTVSMQVNATIGVTQYSHEAVSGATMSLWNSFHRSRRLKNARPLAALHALFELQDDALDERRQDQHCQDLRDLQQDVARAHPLCLRRWRSHEGSAS